MTKFINLEERNRIAEAFSQGQSPLLPASIDEAVDGKISYASLENGLTIRFPFIDGMRVGGRYQVILSSMESPETFGEGGTVQEENQDTVVEVPAARALAFRGQQVALYYFYLEYEESKSPTELFSVEGPIYKPVVDEAVGGEIPLTVLSQGVQLRIRASASMTPGALISVYWWGSNADTCFIKHLTVGSGPLEDVVLPVGPAFLTPIKYASVRVIYTVQSTSGTLTSPLLELRVAGDLSTPEPRYADGNGGRHPIYLLPIDEGGSIPIQLKTQGMVAGDVAILIFVGDRLGTEFVLRHTVRASDIAEGQILYGVPVVFSSLRGGAATWAMVDRVADGAVGSPDLLLTVIIPDRSGTTPGRR
ncbi:hypothetical protein [Pseudomonas mediterranea]|jgi:hypothetical protein|uniref:DUF4255 domain-containing protein n=1 Tax=Pseudomonas mediterranea TaxID=183795 RepID=A0AAX2D6L1_9PSED|nr:hypothetical protein [Pseudomonas mediterranea]MBL0844101.1 hypothetical protein [Pseudomonas mediterranea]UZE00954.1 hypothetical protein LOY71_26285 [Pseudomonas mediterranea]CAH0283212.1 hypothetical protein SRABI112_03980 [Pseudomonas mediterranea]SDU15830.1 hypothetical protein SAMN05216476_0698 [Pseudomonas mediterranea]